MSNQNQELINLNDFNATYNNVVAFVNRCMDLTDDELVNSISSVIIILKEIIKSQKWEEIEPIVHVLNKGFKHVCIKSNSLKFFYMGYYSYILEDFMNSFSKMIIQDKVIQLAQTSHVKEILEYLFEYGCSRQNQIAKDLCINKSNLSRKMEQMERCELVDKKIGPKCVFYELSTKGYEYCRKNGLRKNDFEKNDYIIKPNILSKQYKVLMYYDLNRENNYHNNAKGKFELKSDDALDEKKELIAKQKWTMIPEKTPKKMRPCYPLIL